MRPRREWLSLTCDLKCSVRLLMRSERTATCTSGEPVSPVPVAYSWISVCLRSGVIDMRSSSSKVENTKRPQLATRQLGERNRLALSGREIDRESLKIVACARLFPDAGKQSRSHQNGIAGAQAHRIRTRHGERRDAVQRSRDGPQVLKSGGTMPKRLQVFQWNCLAKRKWPDSGPAKRRNMPHRAERAGKVPHPGPDVSPFAATHFEFGMVRIRLTRKPDLMDEHLAGFELRRFAVARQVVGALTLDPDGREARGYLLDLPREAGQNGLDRLARGTDSAGLHDLAFGIVAVAAFTPTRDKDIGLLGFHGERDGFRRLAERNREHPRGHGIERAGMSRLLRIEGPPHCRDCVGRCCADRLVDDDPTVHGLAFALTRHRRPRRPRRQRRLSGRAVRVRI